MIPMVLGGCLPTLFSPETNALCEGLERPLVEHAQAITQEETPERVIQSGAKVISAYRGACD